MAYRRRNYYRRRPIYRRRWFNRRRPYRPRGFRRSPAYIAFKGVRNLQKQREMKYRTFYYDIPITISSANPGIMLSTSQLLQQGTGPNQMTGRRVKISSVTCNFSFVNLDLANPQQTGRIYMYIMKRGNPVPYMNFFEDPGTDYTIAYPHDDYRFNKIVLVDRKFTLTPTRTVYTTKFTFKIPPHIITTPGEYNNIGFYIISAPTGDQRIDFTGSLRLNFFDS